MNSTAGVSCERESVQVARVCVTAAVLLALAALLVQPETGRAAVLRDERGNVQGLGRTHALTESDLGKRISVGVTLADGGFSQMITSARTGPVKRAPATGRPDISGNLRVGETLTAVTGGIHDRDGLNRTAFSYQWLADDVAIANATGETYTLTAAEQGKRIKLTVTFTDNVEAAESVTSLARGPVVAAGVQNQAPTGLPVISGTVQVGYTLTAGTSGIGDADGLTGAEFTYQWLQNDALLAGETGKAYLVKASDSGHRLKARVYFRDDRGTPETLTSAATVAIPDAPSQGDVRLYQGLALHFFYNGRWGTVCDNDADRSRTQLNRVAQVVCRQLGRAGGEFLDLGFPSFFNASPVVDEVICQGTESRLSACSFTTDIRCTNREAFGIRCTEETGPGDNTEVVIVGEARVGEVLTVSEVLTVNFDWTIEEELSIVYEWLVDNVPVTGETALTYTVRATDLGKRMKARVTFTLTRLGRVSFESPETNPVQPASATLRPNQRPVGVPVITGDARVGRTLTADTSGISDSDGPATLVFSYQWSSDGVAVSTRTASTYTVRAVDEGKSIGVSVSYTDARDFGHTLTSAGTAAVLPSNRNPSGKPEVIGSPKVGNTLTADTSGISDPDGPSTPSFTYQWLGDDQPITGALSATYTLLAAQLGQRVKVRVSFTDGAGNTETLTSPATVTVLAANTANQRPSGTLTVSLSGSWQVNKGTLTVGQGEITDPDGPGDLVAVLLRPASYEWVADGDVAGTGLSFPLTPDVVGKRITLRVSFTDSAGVNETFSSTPGGPVYWRVSATGQPGITGAYRVGDTLTATTTGIVEPDGIDETSLAYEWFADGTAIANATSSTYMLTANELNKRITVRVSFNDRAGDSEVLTSLATGPVRAVGTQDQPATGTVTVRGMPRLGRTLTAVTDGVSDPDGLSSVRFAFQWLADNAAISGATGRTHALTGSDLGKRISVRVTFADDGGFSQMITSAQTGPVTSIPATGRPDTSGILRVGETLTAVTGGIHDRDGLDRTAFSYQWLADDVAIANATGETYTLTAAEQGKRIKLTVTFTDNVGAAESVTSLARGPVVAAGVQNQAPTGLPVISGPVQVGYALTAGTSGISDADGLTSAEFTYQWLRNDALLVGETGIEYLVKASDSRQLLKVRVYFTDDRGTQETLTSAATVAVPDAPREGDIRLYTGNILHFFREGRWGTVCNLDADRSYTQLNRVAQVACRQLGYTGGEYRAPVSYGSYGGSPAIDEIVCQGTETRLTDCTFSRDIRCSNVEAIGIHCTDRTGPGVNYFVVILGEARVGEVLTAEFDWREDDLGVIGLEYQWFVDNVPVTGETATTYTVRATDLGKRIKVDAGVVFTGGVRLLSYESPETNPVQGVPVILGVVAVGQTLTADTSALSDPDGPATLVFSYQWSSDGEAVTGRTASTYVVRGLDTRKSLTVEVSYTDGAGKEERITSEPTVAVPIGTQSQVTALTVAFGVESADVMEGGSPLQVTVALSGPAGGTLTIAVEAKAGGTAAAADYSIVPATLTFAHGESSKTLEVGAVDDDVDEGDETVVLGFGTLPPGLSAGSVGTLTVTLGDNDERGVVVRKQNVVVTEGGSEEYGVVLESEPEGAVTVTVGVPEGTDVSVSPSALTFTAADWQTAQTFTVSAAEDDGDAQVDADVELGHTVSGGDYGGVSASGVTVRISENDRPAVAIADARGMESVGTLEFAVSLDIPSSEVVTVGWATADGTAVAGTDYESGSGSLTFMAGETAAQVIGVKVLDDGVDEEEEGFGVNLMSPVNGVLGDASAEGRIEDNDERGVVVSAAGSGVTVDEGESAEYTVVLESEPEGAVTVTVGVPEGTDVSVSPSALTFTAADWQTAQTFTVSAAEDDGDAQTDADVELGHTVSGGDYGGVSASGVTVRISENDRPAVAIADARGMESVGTLEFAVSLDIPSSEVVTVGWATADGTAVAGTDYESGSGSLTFMAGETAAQVIGVKVLDDGVDEEEEGFGVNLMSPVNGVLGDASAEGRIEDNDERGVVVSAAGSGVTVDEGESAEYTVVLESEPVEAVTVTVRVPEGTEVSVSPSALTFTAADWGEAQTFTVSAANDDVKDAVEVELGHAVSGGDYGAVDVAGVVVRVIDNDEPTLAVTDAVGGESEGERVMRFVVSLSLANLNEAVTVDWATADGTAVAGMDYQGGSGSLTFAAGDVESRTIEVVVKDDGVDEEEEGFSVELGEARNASIGDGSGAGRIADDDERGVTVSPEGLTVEEGGSGEYTVVLESDPEGPVTVAVRVPEGTDVGVSPVALTFTAADWQTVQTFTVSAAEDDGDAQTDAEVELVHAVSGGGYGGESASSVTVRITENDQPTVRIAPAQAAEGAGAMRFAVSLDIPSSREVVVGYETAAGTAEAGADYVETSGSLTFPAGETADEVEVVLRDDDVDEDPVAGAAVAETITVRLRDAENAVLGQEASVEGRIVDDDERGVTVSRERLTVTEGGSESYEVMLESEPEGEVTVAVRVPGGTDVRVSPLALTFTAADWSARQRVTVHAVEDADAEAEPAVSLTHEVSGGDYAGASAAEVRVTVIENDEPTLVVADAEGLENEGFLEFVVGLSTTSSQDVVVAYETRDGTAEAGSDYAAVSGSLTFAAGGNEAQTITVRVLNDEEAETTETFALELRQPVNARLGDASADGRIVDDDDEARATLGGELRTAADGGVVLVYEEARGPVVRLEVAAMADGVNGLDRDRDGEVEEAERPRVRKLSPQELPAVPARLRVRVEADTAVDIEVPGGGSGLAARVCLATGLEEAGLAVYRYDTGTAEWERLESEVEESGGQRYVCADVEGFSVFAVFEEAGGEMVADVNVDGEVNEDDALVMYYAYALSGLVGDGEGGGVARFRRTLLGPRAGSADASDAELMAMVRRANAWRQDGVDAGGDVNVDGEVNEDDALVMYYAYALSGLVGDGEGGGVARFRRTLLGPRAGSADASDAELMAMVRRAEALRNAAR